MARTCPFCKAPLSDGAQFCGSCGSALPSDEARPSDGALPFALRLARPAAFRAARRSPVEVRFRATEDVFSAVTFRLLCADREVAARALGGRPGTAEHRILLQVTPQSPGGAALELRVTLTADGAGEPETYVTRFVAIVDDAPNRSAAFNFAPQFSSDRAGHNEIGTINLNFAGGASDGGSEDISRYETLLPDEPAAPDLLNSPTRLTLRAEDGRTIQLLADEEISFGRSRDNLIVSRIYGADGCLDLAANEGNLSRFHFKIVRRHGEAYIVDGTGGGRGSTYGTRLDGESADADVGRHLVAASRSSVAAGRPGAELVYDVRVGAGGWTGPSGFVVGRGDGAPETVVAVWGGRVGFGEGAFLRGGGRWEYADASGRSVGLGLFSYVRIGGVAMRVMPFHHPFL